MIIKAENEIMADITTYTIPLVIHFHRLAEKN